MRLRPLLIVLSLLAFTDAAISRPSDERDAVRSELLKVANHILRPLLVAPGEGKAWHLVVEGQVDGEKGRIELAWDGRARHLVRARIDGLASAAAAFGTEESWLFLPEHKKLFVAGHAAPEGVSLLAGSKAWSALNSQVPGLAALVMATPIPEQVQLQRRNGTVVISAPEEQSLEVVRGKENDILSLRVAAGFDAGVQFRRWAQVPVAEFEKMLVPPPAEAIERVAVAHLRGMVATVADVLAEFVLVKVNPKSVPDPLAGAPKVNGATVVRLQGTPEEMGAQHGRLLKEAALYNLHRVVHGVGLFSTIETGKWFPAEIASVWEKQEKYIPERYLREIDALSDAVGIPRDWGRSVNVFPELFHCSGLALRGKATVDGKLYHGRVLDYMTEIGLQNTAVVMVFQPTGRHAWASVGYAGLCGTVTAMNAQGLAMGEMGGRGEGYLDGMPMSILMREVVERFDNTRDVLEWMRSTPRTCEYFYVLSDARTRQVAGIASLASELAKERGVPDFRTIEPGVACPELPHAIEDAVLMSADERYERLASRVQAAYGKLDMQGAWDLMGRGVAMKSNLHTALFAPETLDFWIAQAGPGGEPAYTRAVSKLNLRDLLERAELATTASGE